MKVGKAFSNPPLGESGTVLAYVRNYQLPVSVLSKTVLFAQSETVLVQLKVTASKKYYDVFGEGSFVLIPDGGQPTSPLTSVVAPALKAAGYAPLPDAKTGKTTTGWAAFPLKKGATHLVLEYKGIAATSGSTTIPAKLVKIALV